MPKLVWDKSGERYFETGVSKGVLFPMGATFGEYEDGVVWNGLVNVTQSPTGAEPSAIYADNRKYLNLMSIEELEGSIEAYTYPDEFAECDGSALLIKGARIRQQKRKSFGLSYQTKIGNDENSDLGYKIHIIYGCLAKPSERSSDSVNDSPEAATFSWDFTTTPVDVDDHDVTASIEIDSRDFVTEAELAALAALEAKLYGTEAEYPALPTPAEVLTLLTPEPPAEG